MIEDIQNAIELAQDGQYDEAEKLYSKLLLESPDDSILLSSAGLFYSSVKNYEKAGELLQKAWALNKTLGTASAFGFIEFEQQNYENAVIAFENALEYGESPSIYDKLITCLFILKNYNRAVQYAYKMYELYPDNSSAILNMVKAFIYSGKLAEAEQLCVTTLRKKSDISSLWFELGFLKELIYSDDKQAKECYKIASKLGNPSADYNIAVSSQKLGEYDEAEKHYKKMLEKFPNDVDTKTSLGMLYLKQKKFREGYDLFYKRSSRNVSKMTSNMWQPGEKLDEEIIIICDQGFGDHIQFIRYLPFLKNKKIKVAAPQALRKLFELNYKDFEFIKYEEIDPAVQSIRVSDLAYVLDMDFSNIPYSEGYLDAESAQISNQKLKVGLCWEAGGSGIRTMINRTINIKCFEPFFNLENIQIYSFQVQDTLEGNKKYPEMINLTSGFNDFYDTACALKSMDVIISVDTAVAHLAGALGVKTYLLLPYFSDWRWFNDTKHTPWYKSVEIFQQKDPISWEEPFNNIMEKLKN